MDKIYSPQTIPDVQLPVATVANTLNGSIEGETYLNGVLRVGGRAGRAGKFVSYDENGLPSVVIEG